MPRINRGKKAHKNIVIKLSDFIVLINLFKITPSEINTRLYSNNPFPTLYECI